MSNQILEVLKKKNNNLATFGGVGAETRYNVFKEELQFYVLNFIYHHSEYGRWIMYGGSALRIIHGLNRMSVDLDFEVSHPVTENFLVELKKEVEDYFLNTYGVGADFLVVKINASRGLCLKFFLDEELSLGHPSKQVHVKIDLNHFVAPKTVTERQPINHDQFSFVILTYNMGALMASKLAAIFLRGTRGFGNIIHEEKGRDIYDLLWYMGKKIVPDFDYLIAKGLDVKDPKVLFDRITIKVLNNPKTNENLKSDLSPLFVDRAFIENWLKNWRESYLQLLNGYKIRVVGGLEQVVIHEDFNTDNYSFVFWYKTEEIGSVRIVFTISDYWIDFRDGDLSLEADKELDDKMKFSGDGWSSQPAPQDKLKSYAALFYRKTEAYLKKTNRIILGDAIITRVIRMTPNNLNPMEQIVLNKSALLSCELDDLLK